MIDDPIDTPEPLRVAGFWRRVTAFVLDVLLLGVIGSLLGLFLSDFFIGLGDWGRVLGFAVAGLYFAVLDSRAALGGSFGKLVVGLRVVDGDGTAISPVRALLRYLPVGLPYFLNSAPLPAVALRTPWLQLDAAVVFGLALAGLYLLAFNRATRQAVHDRLTGTYVIHRAGAPLRVMWRGHAVVCVLLVVLAGFAPLSNHYLSRTETFKPLTELQATLSGQPWVRSARIDHDFIRHFGFGYGIEIHTHVLRVSVRVVDRDIASQARFDQAALIALQFRDELPDIDTISVGLSYGYDIGIADKSVSRWQSHSVDEWRARLGPSSYQI